MEVIKFLIYDQIFLLFHIKDTSVTFFKRISITTIDVPSLVYEREKITFFTPPDTVSIQANNDFLLLDEIKMFYKSRRLITKSLKENENIDPFNVT